MGIQLTFINLNIPFRIHFKHNSAERNSTLTILIIAQGKHCTGYGEGCPREYVTNESIETGRSFFEWIINKIILSVYDLDSLMIFRIEQKDIIKNNHACWCAIEMALLDLFAKENKMSIEQYLGVNELKDPFYYTAVIGSGSMESFKAIAQRHFEMNFKDFKLKISGNIDEDYSKIKYLKEKNPDFNIRLDANNLWDNQDDLFAYCKNLPFAIKGLEEPLKHKNISWLANIYYETGIPIILDESFIFLADFEEVYKHNNAFILNIRVSKMGGIINSLQIAKRAKELKISAIVGAQVGESSLLTRSSLLIASQLNEYCIGMEGAYGTLLLQDDIIKNPIMFGDGGKLISEDLLDKKEFGLQLNVDREKINNFS